jgi:hypothetical protein
VEVPQPLHRNCLIENRWYIFHRFSDYVLKN